MPLSIRTGPVAAWNLLSKTLEEWLFDAGSFFRVLPVGAEAAELTAVHEGFVAYCVVLVALLNSEKPDRSELGVLVDEIRRLAALDGFGSFFFKPRSSNNVSHCLVRWAISSSRSAAGEEVYLPVQHIAEGEDRKQF